VRDVRAVRSALPSGVPILAGGAASVRFKHELHQRGITVCHNIAEARAVLAAIARNDSLPSRE
ncbi:MAG: hypothetical protein M3Y64_04245, partial [Gemmatimonadota bacterium]|nr:hypothetical protein [Gemmatimonadota bacterium]